ncbi:MAG: aldehyde dehydrogenase family protein, partial [Proteobacteria bacterium]|nr:aldehyde dehydrogenase family protein [Pseudomonadota bacterium]
MNSTREAGQAIKTLAHFVDGSLVAGESGRWSEVFEPASGAISARVPLANAAEVGAAIGAAQAAFPAWSATPPLRRARVMF